jgi:hypothetical protein
MKISGCSGPLWPQVYSEFSAAPALATLLHCVRHRIKILSPRIATTPRRVTSTLSGHTVRNRSRHDPPVKDHLPSFLRLRTHHGGRERLGRTTLPNGMTRLGRYKALLLPIAMRPSHYYSRRVSCQSVLVEKHSDGEAKRNERR